MTEAGTDSRTRLLDAMLRVVRIKGYTATRIEDVCAQAGLTKGSFFHHFRGKEDLALAAVEYWDVSTAAVFATAPYRRLSDPVDRILGYVDFRTAALQGEIGDFTCMIGTMVQEVHETHPAIRDAGERSIRRHMADLEHDIAEARQIYGVQGGWSVESLALHTQAVIQGGFILAKARQTPEVAAAGLDHLRRYIETLFPRTNPKETEP